MKEWSASWQASEDPGKQRKYRANAPHHHAKKFLSASLEETLEDRVGTGTLPVRAGDKVEIMRGDFAGTTGVVEDIDTGAKKLYIDGVTRETVGGSDARVPIDPSNVRVIKLNMDDARRLGKYEVSEEDREAIEVEETVEEEAEEAAEPDETEDIEPEADDGAEEGQEDAAEADVEAAETDYEGIVSGTVDEVREAVESGDLDVEAVLEAEQDGKNRVTLVEWLEKRVESDE